MRKFLSTFFVLCLVASLAFCFVACNNQNDRTMSDDIVRITISIGENTMAMAAIDASKDIHFEHYYNDYYKSETMTSITVGDLSIADDSTNNSYITCYTNIDDVKYSDYTVDPVIVDGEKLYLAGVAIDKIPASNGLKVLFANIVYSSDWSSSTVDTTKGILISFAK